MQQIVRVENVFEFIDNSLAAKEYARWIKTLFVGFREYLAEDLRDQIPQRLMRDEMTAQENGTKVASVHRTQGLVSETGSRIELLTAGRSLTTILRQPV